MTPRRAPRQAELHAFVERWRRATLADDATALAELLADGYVAELPTGHVMDKEDVLRLHGRADTKFHVLDIGRIKVAAHGHDADVSFDCRLEGRVAGDDVSSWHTMTLALRRTGGTWRAHRASVSPPPGPRARSLSGRFAAAARARSALRRFKRGFADVAYLPYRPGEDFAVPSADDAEAEAATLPVPPRELWQGYGDFVAGGAADTERMLEIVGSAGVELRAGDGSSISVAEQGG